MFINSYTLLATKDECGISESAFSRELWRNLNDSNSNELNVSNDESNFNAGNGNAKKGVDDQFSSLFGYGVISMKSYYSRNVLLCDLQKNIAAGKLVVSEDQGTGCRGNAWWGIEGGARCCDCLVLQQQVH